MSNVELFEKLFAEYVGTRSAVAVNSGSSALLASLCYLEQEMHITHVITTPFTFKATSNAILLAGLIPVFVDIEDELYGIDPERVKEAILELTVDEYVRCAILPVHLFGVPCSMDKLMDLSKIYDVPIIEDASQACGATYWKKRCGSMGLMGTFSFYATKNLPTFQGGMITTNVFHVDQWLRKFRNHGAAKNSLPMHILGMNLSMPDILAYIGQTHLRLHKTGMEAELGNYGPDNGFYQCLVPDEYWYQHNPYRWMMPFPVPNAVRAVEYVKEKQR